MLPTFLIIGAPRSGTTTLYNWLSDHPQIFMPAIKELNYFAYSDLRYIQFEERRLELPLFSRNWEAYLDRFAASDQFVAVGEASPAYLSSVSAPALIKERLPHVQLIAILRNPVERAYSHYLMGVRDGWAPGDFEEALALEDVEQAKGQPGQFALNHWYKRAGRYAEQLRRYMALFPPERIKVCLYDDLMKDPAGLVGDLYRYLGVDPTFLPDLHERHNAFGTRRLAWLRSKYETLSYEHPLRRTIRGILPGFLRESVHRALAQHQPSKRPAMPPDVRHQLVEYFRSEVSELQGILGRDLTGWLK